MSVANRDTLQLAKITALFRLVHDLADMYITPAHERYTDQPLGEIDISAVDSLDARRSIWAQVQGSMDTLFFLDERMAITSMDLYAIEVKFTPLSNLRLMRLWFNKCCG